MISANYKPSKASFHHPLITKEDFLTLKSLNSQPNLFICHIDKSKGVDCDHKINTILQDSSKFSYIDPTTHELISKLEDKLIRNLRVLKSQGSEEPSH